MQEILFLIFIANPDYAPNPVLIMDEQGNLGNSGQVININSHRSDTLFWDFESSNGNFNPIPSTWGWFWGDPVGVPAHSGINAWSTGTGEYGNAADWRLESPCIVLDSAGACTLSFYHFYFIEFYFDGGNLKISTNYGISWSIIYPFEPPNYPCDSAFYGNWGIPNEPCFTGDSAGLGWHQAKFLLDDYAGKIIMVRWHFGSDDYDTYPGWYIDDVRITHATGITRDVGPISIIRPAENVPPHKTINPKVGYKNFGIDSVSIYVYLKIDSGGIGIYHDSSNVVLAPSGETVVTFNPWTSGDEGSTYNIVTYTVLTGDQYPLNDTLTQHTVVASRFWELLPTPFPLPSSGHSLASKDDGTYMVFGIHTPLAYLDTTLIYDITTDTWLAGPKNPFGPASYGTANFVAGRFYRIGGTNDFPTPLNRVDIFDPSSGIWSSGMPSPVALIDHITGVYKDSLIYTFGNGNWSHPPSNYVSFYDVYANTWCSATPLPGGGRGACAGGIIDSFAIVACGFKSGGIFCKDYIVGIINSNDPRNITWGTWDTIPGMDRGRYRVPCGVDKLNKELWLVGGKISVGETGETWSYNPYIDTWTNWNLPKPHPVGNVTPIVVTNTVYENLGIFVPSGYHANTYIPEHELFHIGSVCIEEEQSVKTHLNSAILNISPNPAKSYVSISYATTKIGPASLNVYDNSGRLVRTLVKRPIEPPGIKVVYWNCKDNNQCPVPDGIYFLLLSYERGVEAKKLVLIR
uniref:T9SS C-terminal target domain-containing protein n=1 Tax=candidate division WOR-3 bacterium TaxID=2052148 RepID=A0A7C4TBB9_UNCW3